MWVAICEYFTLTHLLKKKNYEYVVFVYIWISEKAENERVTWATKISIPGAVFELLFMKFFFFL